jgi:hypothetical protein
MVRRLTARALKLVEETVCVNVSGLLVENRSPGLDDDPRVSILINPSVTEDAFTTPGFPARRWTVLSSPSLAQQTLVEKSFPKPRSRSGGGKVGSAKRFPSAASLCAVHVRQFEGASPLSNLVEVKD